MGWIRIHRDPIAAIGGFVLPLAMAAILIPFRSSLVGSAAALVLIAVVGAIALNGSRIAGLIASVSASLWFDFFLTRPYEQFAITRRPDIETAISLFLVGVAITELAARNRLHHRVALEESDHLGLLYYLSELVAKGTPTPQVIEQANAELIELLHLRGCRSEVGTSLQHMTRIDHDGSVHIGRVLWGAHRMGLPGPELELPIQNKGKTLGRFVLQPSPGRPVSMQRRLVAIAIADQIGAALAPLLRTA